MTSLGEAQLLHGILAGGKLSHDDTQDRKHGSAPIVELAIAHALRLAQRVTEAELERVAIVTDGADILGRVILPEHKLQQARDGEKDREADGSIPCGDSREAFGHLVKTRELQVVLDYGTHRSHHGNAPMLHLSDTKLAESLLVAHFAETEGIEEAQGLGHAQLLCWIKGRRWRRLNSID